MKKFAKLLVCLILCVFGLGLVACGDNRTEKEKAFTYPNVGDDVLSNGGMAVKKGNYIYFVNGYQSAKDMTTQNASYNLGSLLLMKLDSNGEVVTDEKGLLKDEYFITMSDKLCGFEATNLFIYGEYLYFTSPCQDNEGGESAANTNKKWARDRVDFYRIKLDKKGGVERIYTSEIQYDKIEFKYYSANGNVYIVIYENGTNMDDSSKEKRLVRINCQDKSVAEIATNVSSVVFDDEFNKICFVKTEGSASKLKFYNVADNQTKEISSSSSSLTVKLVGRDYVYVSYTNSGTELAKYEIKENASAYVMCEDISKLDELLISSDGDQVIGIRGNKIKFLSGNAQYPYLEEKEIVDESATKINVVGLTNGSIVYYDNDGNVKVVSYTVAGEIKTIATIAELKDSEEKVEFDVALDDEYVYFNKKVGNNSYLHRLNISAEGGEAEMIGNYLLGDVPKAEESDESTN